MESLTKGDGFLKYPCFALASAYIHTICIYSTCSNLIYATRPRLFSLRSQVLFMCILFIVNLDPCTSDLSSTSMA